MRDIRLGRFFRRFSLVVMAALVASTAAAQDEAAPSDYEAGPAVQPAIPKDGLKFYQVNTTGTEYLPGRLRVANPATGEISPVRKTGLLIIKSGKIVARAESGVGGVAQIPALPAGVYAVVAIGPDGLGTFAMEILPEAVAGAATPTYCFDALMVPAVDVTAAQEVLVGNRAPAPAAIPAPPAPAPLPPIPASLKKAGDTAIVSAPVYVADEFGVDGPAAPCKGETVTVGPRERMVGQLVVLDSRTARTYPFANGRVAFLRGGRVLGTVETNSEGYCAATGMDSGVYSMVAIGPSGVIAVGVQVDTVIGAATAGSDGLPTATTQVTMLQEDVPTVDLQAAAADADTTQFVPGFGGPGGPPPGAGPPPPPPGAGFGAGGGAGGGFGGGGGGGGGGLWGALLGAGLGAGIGAAIAADDDDESPPVVVSPNNP